MEKLRTIEMQRLTVEEFREAEKLPLVVVLDDVRSMHNVGSVFRTGDAFRIEAVYLCGRLSIFVALLPRLQVLRFIRLP